MGLVHYSEIRYSTVRVLLGSKLGGSYNMDCLLLALLESYHESHEAAQRPTLAPEETGEREEFLSL